MAAHTISREHRAAAIEEYEIMLTVKEETGSYSVVGVALNPLGKPVPHTRRVRNASSKSAVATKKKVVEALVNSAIAVKASRTRSSQKELDGDNAFVRAFQRVVESGNPVNPKWNPESRRTALTYFERHTLPFLQKYDDLEFLSSDREELTQEIYKSIDSNGRSSGVDIKMRQTLQNHLAEADIIYKAMQMEDPALPTISFCPQKKQRIQLEAIKSLPRALRRRFARELVRRADTEPEMVFGAVLMWDTGLRTAEAAAVIFDADIRFIDTDQAVVYVSWQEKNGFRSPILKTKNGYRVVPLSYWGLSMLRRCIGAMGKEENDRIAPRRTRELSSWIRDVLSKCGCDDVFWTSVQTEELQTPDRDDDGNPIYDISAYVLRRDRCSIWRNVCGLTQQECDYFLGHAIKLPQRKRHDLRTDEALRTVIQKLERFVYDEDLSRHPYFRPVELSHGLDIDVVPFEAFRFTNSTDHEIRVSLDLLAKIVNEPIELTISNESKVERIRSRSGKLIDRRPNEPICGSGQIGGF